MSDSPLNTSNADEYAAFRESYLDSDSDTYPPEPEAEAEPEPELEEEEDDDDDDDDDDVDAERTSRKSSAKEPNEAAMKEDICTHPGFMVGMCIKCGEEIENADQSGVGCGYIHKGLRLGNDEMDRLRNNDLKDLLTRRKLYLILEIDHILLNTTRFLDATCNENYLWYCDDPMPGYTKFQLSCWRWITKLRPFVHTFLKEASELFGMCIYTMGEPSYAKQMAELLDPEKVSTGEPSYPLKMAEILDPKNVYFESN